MPQAKAYYQVFIFADGTRLLSEEPISIEEAKASHGSNAELVSYTRMNPHLRSALKSARAEGKFPPALPNPFLKLLPPPAAEKAEHHDPLDLLLTNLLKR